VGADNILRQLQYLPVVDALTGPPEAVSSAHWGDLPNCTSSSTLLDALLKLLSTNAPTLLVNDDAAEKPLGYITLDSINHKITQLRKNHLVLQKATQESNI
jgi:osmoprotectant transport system ATP-binding protein